MRTLQNKIVLTAAGLCAQVSFAPAADIASYENPFAGFYLGVHAGYGWAGVDEDYTSDMGIPVFATLDPVPERTEAISGNYTLDASGGLLGAQAGFNAVMSNGLLLGAEINGSWSEIRGDTSFQVSDAKTLRYGMDADVESRISALGLAQAKLGWANDSFAVYGMGGLAVAQFQRDATISGGVGSCIAVCEVDLVTFAEPSLGSMSGGSDLEDTLSGWTLGAGLDVMVAENVSLGVAYNYARFEYEDSFSVDPYPLAGVSNGNGKYPSSNFETSGHVDVHVVKATLNYHF